MSDQDEPGPSGAGSTISFGEYFAECDEMERNYEAVLSGSDDKYCTYSKVRILCSNKLLHVKILYYDSDSYKYLYAGVH